MFAILRDSPAVSTPADLVRELAAAVAAIGSVDAAELGAEDRVALLNGLWRAADQLQAEVAALARAADVAGDWAHVGAASAVSWLALRTQSHASRVRERLRVGAAFERLPSLAAAVRAGTLSWDAATVVATTATGRTAGLAQRDESVLVGQATTLPLADLVQVVRHWRRLAEDEVGDGRPPDPAERRSFTAGRDSEGWLVGRIVLEPEAADVVLGVLGRLAGPPHEDGRLAPRRRADALVELCDAFAKGTVTGGRGAPVVLWQAPAPVASHGELSAEPTAAGGGAPRAGRAVAWTEDGTLVDGAWLARLACSSPFARLVLGADGLPLDVGREERFATAAIWRALVARDGGCSHPWCDRPPGWCEAHHVSGVWDDERTITAVGHMALACARHHHLAHEGGWRVDIIDGRPVWTNPRGDVVRPPAPLDVHLPGPEPP